MYRRAYILLLLLGWLLSSCGDKKHHAVTRGIYYWKTVYNPTAYERGKLADLQMQRVYLRLFDMDDVGNGAYPVAVLRMAQPADSSKVFVPVIFITQKVIADISLQEITELSHKISSLAKVVCSEAGIKPPEIQIDCDWTARNKDAYFELLRQLKKHPFFANKTLSCTIRLHQVKYVASSGIPPVDRGLLMCYNMGNMKKPGNHNSILSAEEAIKYLGSVAHYPLKLDVALPLFSWSVLFHQKIFRGILRDITPEMIAGSGLFRKEGDNHYRCQYDTVWAGYRFHKMDVVRTEVPSLSDISHVARYTADRLSADSINIIYFSCDSITLSKFTINELEAVYNTYL